MDKSNLLRSNEFGYLSVHLILKMDSIRSKLPEYEEISDIWIEIQIRTILQHTWAEIEHDLGYKGDVVLPYELRRHFTLLSGQLELADMEFERLIEKIDIYKEKILLSLRNEDNILDLNYDSLRIYIQSNKKYQKIEEEIADYYKMKLNKNKIADIGKFSKKLLYIGIRTIGQFTKTYIRNLEYIKKWIDKVAIKEIEYYMGFSINYLIAFLVAEKGGDYINQFAYEHGLVPLDQLTAYERGIDEIYNEVKK